jgi:hypothetical protein
VQLKLPHIHRITAVCHKRSGTVDEDRVCARIRFPANRG